MSESLEKFQKSITGVEAILDEIKKLKELHPEVDFWTLLHGDDIRRLKDKTYEIFGKEVWKIRYEILGALKLYCGEI